MAKKYHPDKGRKDKSTEEKFKEITEAYNVLSKPEERKRYDQMRENPFIRNPHQAQDFDPFWMYRRSGGTRASGRKGSSAFEDIFRRFFGEGFSFYDDPFGATSTLDQKAQVTISFQQAIKGGSIMLATENGKKIRVKLKPGMYDGQTIRLKGKGRINPFTGKNGDLYLKINVLHHPVFRVKGKNIYSSITISSDQALYGARIRMQDAWDDSIELKIPPNTREGKVLRLKGRGLGMPGKRGDFFIKIHIRPADDIQQEKEDLWRSRTRKDNYN